MYVGFSPPTWAKARAIFLGNYPLAKANGN